MCNILILLDITYYLFLSFKFFPMFNVAINNCETKQIQSLQKINIES